MFSKRFPVLNKIVRILSETCLKVKGVAAITSWHSALMLLLFRKSWRVRKPHLILQVYVIGVLVCFGGEDLHFWLVSGLSVRIRYLAMVKGASNHVLKLINTSVGLDTVWMSIFSRELPSCGTCTTWCAHKVESKIKLTSTFFWAHIFLLHMISWCRIVIWKIVPFFLQTQRLDAFTFSENKTASSFNILASHCWRVPTDIRTTA